MLDEKRIKQIESRVRNFLSDGTIQKTRTNTTYFIHSEENICVYLMFGMRASF